MRRSIAQLVAWMVRPGTYTQTVDSSSAVTQQLSSVEHLRTLDGSGARPATRTPCCCQADRDRCTLLEYHTIPVSTGHARQTPSPQSAHCCPAQVTGNVSDTTLHVLRSIMLRGHTISPIHSPSALRTALQLIISGRYRRTQHIIVNKHPLFFDDGSVAGSCPLSVLLPFVGEHGHLLEQCVGGGSERADAAWAVSQS